MKRSFVLLATIAVMASPLYADDSVAENYIKNLKTAMNNAAADITPSHSVKHAANLIFAHGALIKSIPEVDILAAIDALSEAKITRIDINPSVAFWADPGDAGVVAEYKEIAQRVHERGLKLAVVPLNQGIDAPPGGLAAYQALCVKAFPKMVADLHPDAFIVVHEPSTMARELKIDGTPEEWAAFATATAQAIRAIDPKVHLGAGGLSSEAETLRAFIKVPDLDIFTLDIYAVTTLEDDTALANEASKAGKHVFIEETWRPPLTNNGTDVGDATFKEVDCEWVHLMDQYGRTGPYESVCYYWTNCFFLYGNGPVRCTDPGYQKAAAHMAAQKQVSRTYVALQEVCGVAP